MAIFILANNKDNCVDSCRFGRALGRWRRRVFLRDAVRQTRNPVKILSVGQKKSKLTPHHLQQLHKKKKS